jgi:hypothetical protein
MSVKSTITLQSKISAGMHQWADTSNKIYLLWLQNGQVIEVVTTTWMSISPKSTKGVPKPWL